MIYDWRLLIGRNRFSINHQSNKNSAFFVLSSSLMGHGFSQIYTDIIFIFN